MPHVDHAFHKYNPNPEDRAMLMQTAGKVRETDADLALGFYRDGKRCGVVDDAPQSGIWLLGADPASYNKREMVLMVEGTRSPDDMRDLAR